MLRRPSLWGNKFSTRFAILKTIRRTTDIRKAGGNLNRVRIDELQLEHIINIKGNMQRYFKKYSKTHEDALKHAEEVAEELLDEIRFSIADLQVLKHTIHEMYGGDEKLKGRIPPKIEYDLKAGDKHTQAEVNEILRRLGVMFGELSGVDNIK